MRLVLGGTMTARLTLILIFLSLGAGCSDYHLAASPDEPMTRLDTPSADDGVEDVLAPTALPGKSPESSESASSPWDMLEPGSLPEVFFAAVWNDPREACVNCFMPQYAAPRYEVIDVMGRVVLSFTPPESSLWSTHGSIQPFGPGRFLATTHVSDADDPEFPWKAWIGDATTGQTELVMEWGWHNVVRLPVAGEKVVLPQFYGDLIVIADPVDPDRVFLLTDNTMMYAQPLLGSLTSVDVRDPLGEVRSWQPEEMVDPVYFTEWTESPWAPWLVRAVRDGDRTVLVLGLQTWGADGLLDTVLVGFDPETGPLDWALDLTEMAEVDPWSASTSMLVRPPSSSASGRALFHRGEETWCPSATFGTWDGETLTEFDGAADLLCTRIGPQLDDEGETFVYYGADAEEDGDGEWGLEERLVVSHRGSDVWELSELQVGLGTSPFDMHELILLKPVDEQ